MSNYEDYEYKLDFILKWAKTKKKFEPSTFEGIQEYYDKRGNFTLEQMSAIDNVYYGYQLHKLNKNNLKKKIKESI